MNNYMVLIGFVVNPIAGMGGRVGLKGTDDMAEEARRRGAEPVAHARALAMLGELQLLLRDEPERPSLDWVTCPGPMGADVLSQAGITASSVLPSSPVPPVRYADESSRRFIHGSRRCTHPVLRR